MKHCSESAYRCAFHRPDPGPGPTPEPDPPQPPHPFPNPPIPPEQPVLTRLTSVKYSDDQRLLSPCSRGVMRFKENPHSPVPWHSHCVVNEKRNGETTIERRRRWENRFRYSQQLFCRDSLVSRFQVAQRIATNQEMVARVAGMLRAPRPVQGAVLARAEQAAALAAQELVDQVEAVQGEAVHRLILPGRSHRCAQSFFAK